MLFARLIQQWSLKKLDMLRQAVKITKLLHLRISFLFGKQDSTQSAPKCLVLHPVTYPNKGPVIEQYLAEEAIGLVSSLKWQVVPGPFWVKGSVVQSTSTQKMMARKYGKLPNNSIVMQPTFGTEIKDGTYVKTSIGSGVYYKDGIIFDQEETETDGDLHSEWQNKKIRESLANSSLIHCKKVTQKYYFTKGKLQKVMGHVLKTQPSCLFINSQLKPGQIRNLKKLFESQLNNKKLPKGYLSETGEEGQSDTQLQSTEQVEEADHSRRRRDPHKKIQIFDRFSIILQIFAQRTTSKLAKLQIELSYLSYLKTRLVRDGSTYSSNLNLFSGSLLDNSEISLEIISAKQRRAIGTMSGEGESQLEIERRNIKNKEAKIRKQIETQTKLRQNKKEKDKIRNSSMPIIALVGYTNVGKSAFMNYIMGKEQVSSKDLLFQTLKTTSRQYEFIQLSIDLPSGTKAILMDTIGFITDLPVEMIDSFKVTLEDISNADLVIHLRDLSHPQNELQKQSVLSILKQLKFSPEFYTDKMIEVWNKVDLVENLPQITSDQSSGESKTKSEIRVSCKTGQGMSKLLKHIDRKLQDMRGLNEKQITYGFQHHLMVSEWLKKMANIPHGSNYHHDYESTRQFPQGSVTIEVNLDDLHYNKLLKFISEISNKESKEGKKDKSRKGLPPKEGW